MQQTMTLQLDVFEGPLDLLLYLIRKNDLEISRISISIITNQYLDYLNTLQELDIDLASEFLFMAADLAHLKSRSLLPRTDADEPEAEDDVANDLIARLKDYERYKMAGDYLKKKNWLDRDVFVRGSFVEEGEQVVDDRLLDGDEDDDTYDVDSYELIRVFHDILNKLPKEEANHKVMMTERVSVSERIYELLDRMGDAESMVFEDLFVGERRRIDVVVTFLAILEMCKLKMARVFQSGVFGTIRIQKRLDVEDEVQMPKTQEEFQALDDYK